MGSGFSRNKKMQKAILAMNQMQQQATSLVNDPQGSFQKIAQPLIAQLQSAQYEKNKLSALVCALLEASGGTVTLKRSSLDQFQNKTITIKTLGPDGDDGVNPDADLVFSFTATESETENAANITPIASPAPGTTIVAAVETATNSND